MRTFSVGTLGGLVAWFGFTVTASASQTIDLLWGGTSTSISSVSASTNLVLFVRLTNNSEFRSSGGAVTVDYSDALSQLSVVSFQNFLSDNSGQLPLSLGPLVDTGSQIRNINAASFIDLVGFGLPSGASYLLGTVTFHKEAGPPGTFNITPLLTGTDFFSTLEGESVVIFNGASLTNVPEPGTAFLLVLGLSGLASAARREN
jgi:hypothetical protein